jgi:hypothetical protein
MQIIARSVSCARSCWRSIWRNAVSGRDRPAQAEREQDERGASDEQGARDRELLDYLIEVTWAAMIRRLRSERERDEGE